DSAAAYEPNPEAKVPVFTGSLSAPHIHHWQHAVVMAPGKFTQRGYDFKKPTSLPTGDVTKGGLVTGHNDYEIFRYEAESEFHSRSKKIAGIRLDALQRDMQRRQGASNCRSFSIGKTFTITKHDDPAEMGKQYVL